MKPLYACLVVPDFPASVLLKDERNVQPPATAVVSGVAPHQTVFAANEPARRGGVREGMPLSAARARFARQLPDARLSILPRDEQIEEQTQQGLLETALTISPLVENVAAGLLLADLAGLPDPHAAASEWSHATERLGLPANVGVSRNRFAALCAARARPGITHLFPGEEEGFLGALPVTVLPLKPHERETFVRWGIGTLGELARLPEEQLTARFGERGAWLVRLAKGREGEPFEAWQPPRVFEEHLSLDWEVRELEPLVFLIAGPLQRLCGELRDRNLAAEAVRITLRLADGSHCERLVPLAQPLTDAQVLLTLVRLHLAAHPPDDAIEEVRLSLRPVPRRRLQQLLFERAQPSAEKLAVTLARLVNLLGADHIGSPAIADSHRPRGFRIEAYAPPREVAGRQATNCEAPKATLALRCFRPAIEAAVNEENGRPAHIESTVVRGPIVHSSGPWRTSGEWWTENIWRSDEWDIETACGRYRLCCDQPGGLWCVVGAYD